MTPLGLSKMDRVIIVTGSRDWTYRNRIWLVLDAEGPDLVVHGGARGADDLAEQWCKLREVDSHAMRAKWSKGVDGQPRRNVRMLDAYPTATVHAFPLPDSVGTVHCMTEAERRGMHVVIHR